jgi:hypothetical protein
MLSEFKVSFKFIYKIRYKKSQGNFQTNSGKQTFKWRSEDNIDTLLRKRNCENGVDRTGSKLYQVGGFIVRDFEFRNLVEYHSSNVYRIAIHNFIPEGRNFSMCWYLRGKLTFKPKCEGYVRQS